MTSPLPSLPPITHLSASTTRILGANPSKFTLQGTNTYLLGTGAQRLLIDTGEGKPEWAESLRSVLAEEKASVRTVLLTHWHGDHVGGVGQVQELMGKEGVEVEVRKHASPSGREEGAGWGEIRNGEVFEVEGVKVRAVYTPGHADDHCVFVVEGGGEDGTVFAGDNVLGHGTAVFEDLAAYMDSLARMEGLVKGKLYCAHGEAVEDGKAKVREYIEHRMAREREAVEVLGREKDGGWGSMEMVKVIYAKYPEGLHGPAERGLKLVLKKLEGEGKVRQEGGKWMLAAGGKEGRL